MKPQEIKDKTLEKYKKYINPSLARLLKMMGADRVEGKARGAKIWDLEGRRFIDCLGSYGVFNAGWCHPKIVSAVREQLRKMPLTSKVFLNKPLADLSALLAEITPGDLQYSFICNSGAEAVEGALKLARLYTRRTKIISSYNAFHGKTLGALSVSGRKIYKEPFEPLIPDCVQIPFGDISALQKEMDKNTAAVILEPIQGEGGIIIPEPDFLKEVKEICKKNNSLLILDEVQTGMGRCGEMFACEYFKVVPDIICMAKALGGGIMPIGAFTSSEKIWKALLPNPLLHTSTFGGNPLACAAAIAAIEVIREENLPQRAKEMGSYLLSRLQELEEDYPEVIFQIRGLGLLIGIELTKEGLGGVLLPEMIKQGVLVAYTLNNPKVIRLEPPLNISKKEIDYVLSSLNKALSKAKILAEKIV